MTPAIIWRLENRKISELKPYHKNPRLISKDQAANLSLCMEKFGLIDKPIVTRDGVIIGGHQRISLLKRNQQKEVECWIPNIDLSEKQIEELNLRLNKNQGEFDWDILANQYEGEELLTYGFEPEDLLGIIEKEDSKQKLLPKNHEIACPNCNYKFET